MLSQMLSKVALSGGSRGYIDLLDSAKSDHISKRGKSK